MINQSTYNQIVARFEAFASGHFLIQQFTHGSLQEMIEQIPESGYPLMHIELTAVEYEAGMRSFRFNVILADIPRDKEVANEYQREAISDMIQIGEDLIAEIRNGGVIFGIEAELDANVIFTPFVASYTHTLAGVTLDLRISLPYSWTACDIPAEWSVPGSGTYPPGSGGGALLLKVNGVPNAVQSILDLIDGDNIDIEDQGNGKVKISAIGGGGGSSAWGSITGTLSNQTDLQLALDLKADISSLAAVAFSGDYNDLINTPSLPSPIGDMLKSTYDTDEDGIVDKAETIQIIVRNSTGSPLLKGAVVYLSGATGNRPNAVLADASSEATSSKTIGIVVANIANNSDGQVAVNGTLHNLDTSAFTAGASLWLSETPGAMQENTPPAEPAHAVFIGYVARSHPNLGRIVIAIQNGYELNELHGVEITNPQANQALIFAADDLWRNTDLDTDLVLNASGNVVGSTATEALDTLANDLLGKVDTARMINTDAPLQGGGDLSADLTISLPQADALTSGYLLKNDFALFAGKQDAITLTTSGNSGAATLVGNTLNIPDYTASAASTSPSILKSNNAVTHTGTIAETILFSGLIPISLAGNDQIDFSHFLGSNVTNGNSLTWRGYLNTQNNLTGAQEIYRYQNTVGTATGLILGRRAMVNVTGASGVIRIWQPALSTASALPFLGANAPLTTITINTTGNLYFLFTCTISNAAFIANMFHINIAVTR